MSLNKYLANIIEEYIPVYIVFKIRNLHGSREREEYFGIYNNFNLAEKFVMKDINDHYKEYKYHNFKKKYEIEKFIMNLTWIDIKNTYIIYMMTIMRKIGK